MTGDLAIPNLPDAVQQLLQQIEPGRFTTYGDLARTLGDVRAARWVGEYLLDHPHTDNCGCHRVVRADGHLGLYITGDSEAKTQRLAAEGVAIRAGRVDIASRVMPAEFDSDAPLQRLQEFQARLAQQVDERPLKRPPELYCGLDVAYRSDGTGMAAAVLLEADSLQTMAEFTYTAPATFPYIPGYLTFRELPLLRAVWNQVRSTVNQSVLCLVDGNGRLHPRQAGIASCFGVLTETPTIGIAKKQLCGRLSEDDSLPSPAVAILDGDDVIGVSLPSSSPRHPLYISVGSGLSLTEAVAHVCRTLVGHRLPEPTYRADQLSKQAKRSFPT
ncbi:MAG: endonuclease V [Planctomycetaceae bacterium]